MAVYEPASPMPNPGEPFSPAVVEKFRKEDILAGQAVVVLMSIVFMYGLGTFITVCLVTQP